MEGSGIDLLSEPLGLLLSLLVEVFGFVEDVPGAEGAVFPGTEFDVAGGLLSGLWRRVSDEGGWRDDGVRR